MMVVVVEVLVIVVVEIVGPLALSNSFSSFFL